MTQVTIEQAVEIALRHQQQGQTQQAEAIYLQVLQQHPAHAQVLNNLAIIWIANQNPQAEGLLRRAIESQPALPDAHANLGQFLAANRRSEEAVVELRRAVTLNPGLLDAHNNLGIALKDLGKLDESEAAFRRAIALREDFADAHNNLGNLLLVRGDVQGAIKEHRRAVELRPNNADARYNLASDLLQVQQPDAAIDELRLTLQYKPDHVDAAAALAYLLQQKGVGQEAEVWFRRGLALNPDSMDMLNNFSNLLVDNLREQEAIVLLRRAVALSPNMVQPLSNLGNALRIAKQPEEAVRHLRRALEIDPNCIVAHDNLGSSLRGLKRTDEAILEYQKAIELDPKYGIAYSNLGVMFHEQGRIADAANNFRKATECFPDNGSAHYNLALTLLLLGEYEEAWKEHEWRWKARDFPSPRRNFPQPQWDGSPALNKTILVHAEQGFGDTLQFGRFIPDVVQRAGDVIFELHSELVSLMQFNKGLGAQRVMRRFGGAMPDFDLHIPLVSLPLVLKKYTPADARMTEPYIHADPERIKVWQEKLAGDNSRLRVGIAWAGRPTHGYDHWRSMPLATMAPLAMDGVKFYSLQFGPAAAQIKTPPPGMDLVDHTGSLKDFSDTAALISQLDLLICCDTAVIHLAGAMGKPAWVLIQNIPDFRWTLSGERTPWYPTVRLFRQSVKEDWTDPMQRAVESLRAALDGGDPEVVPH